MKVKELIEALGKYDPELKVVVDGYEGGYDDPEELEMVKIIEGKRTTYDEKYGYASENSLSGETAVCIPR